MSECLGLGRASARAKLQRGLGDAATPAQVLRGGLVGEDAAQLASELAAAHAAAAAERERCADLTSAVEQAEASVRELEHALFLERRSCDDLRAAAARSADDVATWRAKYDAAVRAGRTMAALDARPVLTAQAVYGLPEPHSGPKLLTDGTFEPRPAPAGSVECDARQLREGAAHREKRAWLTEVQVMEETIAALRARVDAQRAASAASGRPGDDTPRLPLDSLPSWAATALHGQLVNTRARFGADAAEAAEAEATACLKAALHGLVLDDGASRRLSESTEAEATGAGATGGHDDGTMARDDALRLVEELRSDWEVDAAQLQAQLQAALQRAEKAERIVVAHAMQEQPSSGRASTSSYGGGRGDAAITVAALQSEIGHLRAALAERCETQAALEEALEEALRQQQAGSHLAPTE
jgi:hypothetical protein